jgi:hypothetical protein
VIQLLASPKYHRRELVSYHRSIAQPESSTPMSLRQRGHASGRNSTVGSPFRSAPWQEQQQSLGDIHLASTVTLAVAVGYAGVSGCVWTADSSSLFRTMSACSFWTVVCASAQLDRVLRCDCCATNLFAIDPASAANPENDQLVAMRRHWMYVPTRAKRKPFEYCFTSKPLPHHLIAPA